MQTRRRQLRSLAPARTMFRRTGWQNPTPENFAVLLHRLFTEGTVMMRDRGPVLALDIGGTHTRMGLMDRGREPYRPIGAF